MFTQHRVGAVIVKGNRVLSTGYNELTYSKFIGKPSVHAEERAVVKLLKEHRLSDLAGSTIYVSRFTKSGKLGVSRPCCRCSDLLRSVGVVRAFYTEDGGLVGEMRL
jgi:deoxycytidylate deaminase